MRHQRDPSYCYLLLGFFLNAINNSLADTSSSNHFRKTHFLEHLRQNRKRNPLFFCAHLLRKLASAME